MFKFIREKIFIDDVVCPWWLAYTFDNRIRKFFHNPDKMFSKYIRKGMTVLDIGCGMGYFSIGMAAFVGDKGKVIALDIQEKMLEVMKKRAEKAGMLKRITPHLSTKKDLKLKKKVDFALSFWMVHEVPDINIFLKNVYNTLNKHGRYFIAEPKMHTSEKYFSNLESLCLATGFRIIDRPEVSLSRAVLLER
ncbi:MAG: methyltransferase domain-containing protein [Spirochaetota bacterium]